MPDLTQHLIARVLPDAYAPRPGQPAPRYSEQQARQVLGFLARQMNQDQTRDLAWWQIPRWAPTTPRIITSMLAGGLLGAVLGWLMVGLGDVLGFALAKQHLWEGPGYRALSGLLFGLGVGLSLGLEFGRGGREPKRVRTWRAIRLRSVLTTGLVYGLVYLLLIGFTYALAFAFASVVPFLGDALDADPNKYLWVHATVVLIAGLVAGLPLRLKRDMLGEPSDKPWRKWRKYGVVGLLAGPVVGLLAGPVVGLSFALSPEAAEGSLVEAILGGLMVGLLAGLVVWLAVCLLVWLVVGLVPRLVGGLVGGLAVGFAEDEGSPQGPRESWRSDQVFGIVAGLAFGLAFGLMVGLAFGLGYGLGSGFRTGLALGLTSGLGFGLPVGLVYGITSSVTWPTTLAWLELQRSRRIPPVGVMPFLDDARDRGVLRTIGAVYQFRHATLQDHLAGQTISGLPASATWRRP